MKTLKADIRSLSQLQKDITKMRKQVAAAVKRHQKLQERIARLEAAGCIISMQKDAEIVAGDGCHYVKADSLNPNKYAESNWYYQVICIEEYGVYQCSCEDVRSHDHCKHVTKLSKSFEPQTEAEKNAEAHDDWMKLMRAEIHRQDAEMRQLGATFAPVAKEEQEVQAYFLGLCKTQPETKKLSAEEANQFFMEQAEKRNQAPLNGQAGFQLMR